MNAVAESLSQLFIRDLNRLENEIKAYPNDELLWVIQGDIKNPTGNLCLHLCGNLQYYFGTVLGNSGYARNRDLEFSAKGLSRDYLIAEIQKTKHVVAAILNSISTETLEATYPEIVFTEPMSTQYFLIHLQGHLNYHLGQINYHRRLVAATKWKT